MSRPRLDVRLQLLAVFALCGCAASGPNPTMPPPRPAASSVLVLPSPAQASLASGPDSVDVGSIRSRNQARLGGPPVPGAGPTFVVRDSRDDQRIVNGRNQSTILLRVRSGSSRNR